MNWNIDNFQAWINQNALNLTLNGVASIGAVAIGASFGLTETATTGISNIFSMVKEVYQHSMTPNSARGNINGGDINFASDENTFFFYKKSIKAEFAKVIDDFLTKYGYKVNSLKAPNIFGRRYFNYVKTGEANVVADDVPEKYLNEYKQMLNSGITFWHDTNHFMDYSVNNEIV